jgi:hypothetical protein
MEKLDHMHGIVTELTKLQAAIRNYWIVLGGMQVKN